jgi:GAF domain-containing protein
MYVLIGALFGFVFPIVAVAVSLAQAGLPWNAANFLAVHRLEPLLWIIDTAPFFLGFMAGLAGLRQDALEQQNTTLRERDRELSAIRNGLEERIAARTDQFQQRNEQLQAAARLARRMAEIQDPNDLARVALASLASEFSLQRAELYTVDQNSRTAERLASSSPSEDAGLRTPVIRIGDPSLVGQVAARGEMAVAPASATSVGLSSDMLPDAVVNEIGLPLSARGRVQGVLRLLTPPAQGEAAPNLELLQLLADQLAVSLDNARLYQSTRRALNQSQDDASRASRTAWQDYWQQRDLVFQYFAPQTETASEDDEKTPMHTLDVPLTVRGQRVGSVTLRRRPDQPWTEPDLDLAQKAATQVALALENLRLIEETRLRAAYEQRLSEISAKLGSSVDIDTLLQTAVRELAGLPEVAEATVFLNPTGMSDDGGQER